MEIKNDLTWEEKEDSFQYREVTFPMITDPDTLHYLTAHEEARQYEEHRNKIKREQERWTDRFKVPKGLNKKELTALQKATQKQIDFWLDWTRKPDINEITKEFCESVREKWAKKKESIVAILNLHEGFGEVNIEKAKQYPIEQLLEFRGGFANCPFHGPEKTNSMKLYKDRNKAHCFGCGMDADAIDIYQKINNVDFNTAIKALS